MAKIIGFNADERLKLMASALASRLGYSDVSSMMRALLEEKINATFSPQEREQLLKLLSPLDTADDKTRPFAAASGRRKAAS